MEKNLVSNENFLIVAYHTQGGAFSEALKGQLGHLVTSNEACVDVCDAVVRLGSVPAAFREIEEHRHPDGGGRQRRVGSPDVQRRRRILAKIRVYQVRVHDYSNLDVTHPLC